MLKQYVLFAEWRSRAMYGESLRDAIERVKKLQRPDEYADGRKISNGEWVQIKSVVQDRDTSNSTRGGSKYLSVIIETDDGRYLDVDAVESEITTSRGDRINDSCVVK